MNTGFLHYLRKEYHCKGQQNNQDSIFSGTHGLLVLFYRHFQINSEVRVLNIFDTGILIIYKHLRIISVQVQHLPLSREVFLRNLPLLRQVITIKTWSIPVCFQGNSRSFTQGSKINGLRSFQLYLHFIG